MNNKTQNLKNTFFIHDYETFGKNPALDRPSQFAGIRTDYNFNPIEDAKIFFCRLPNDYLPNPEAVLLTEIDPISSLNTGLQECKFAKKIQNIFNTPKTCILGYNNIRFDNEFSRNIFYRNFYDPYSWSWKQENSNWDVLHIMRAFYILRPEGIKWPLNEKGLPSFRLEDLSKSNNISHEKKHDALSDVYATLELAKLAKNAQPKLFNYLFHYRKKKELKKLINLHTMTPLLYIPTNTFYNDYNITYIIPLIWHPNNPNLLIAYNLNTNLETLWKKNVKSSKKQNTNIHTDNYKKILTLIHINKCPILTPINVLRSQDLSRLNINPQYYLNNFKQFKKFIHNNEIIKKIIQITITSYNNHNNILHTEYEKSHVDNQLYIRFFNQIDQHKMNIINKTTPEILSKLHINFYDNRLNSLLFYYRARNFPNTLNYCEKNDWLNYRKKLFTEQKLTNYTEQLNHLFHIYNNDIKKINLLNSLKQYLQYIDDTLKM